MLFPACTILPILSHASEVWAVDEKVGDAAEQLHRHFLKHVLGIRGDTSNSLYVHLLTADLTRPSFRFAMMPL